MASQNLVDGDLTVRGTLKPTALSAPASCIGDTNIDGSNPITALKQQHQHQKTYKQSNGSASVSDRQVIHVAYGATGSVVAVRAGVVTAQVGGATLTIDLKKNGTSILTGTFQVTSAQAAFALVGGSIASASYVTGDVFEVVVTAATGGGTQGQGLFVDVIFREDAA